MPPLARRTARRFWQSSAMTQFRFYPMQTCANLANKHRHSSLNEIPHSPCIPVQISTCEPLIRTIKERIVFLLNRNVCDRLPLLLGGIDPRRIMRAGMQEEHRSWGCTFQTVHQPIKVKRDRFRVIVGVRYRFNADVFEDGVVVR